MPQVYRYELTEPEGKNFDLRFQPELTPKQMLELGGLGGRYWTDCRSEFPEYWFENAKRCSERRDPALNGFGVNASNPLCIWRDEGWVHPEDPRGWYPWHCRYNLGRRSADEPRQVRRWLAMKRRLAQFRKHCRPGDLNCRRRQRQALLRWANDSRRV